MRDKDGKLKKDWEEFMKEKNETQKAEIAEARVDVRD